MKSSPSSISALRKLLMVVPPQNQTTKKLTPKPIRKDRENTSSPLQIEKTPNKIRTNKNAIGMADRMN